MYLQNIRKNIEKKNLFFVGILSATDEKKQNRIRIRKSVTRIPGSVSVPKCQECTKFQISWVKILKKIDFLLAIRASEFRGGLKETDPSGSGTKWPHYTRHINALNETHRPPCRERRRGRACDGGERRGSPWWTACRRPEMEFLDINLTKDSSLLLSAIHIPFYWRILKKTILFSGLKILTKKSAKLDFIHE